jgi:hypothetical protein
MPTLIEKRASFDFLRSVCRDFQERLILGEAIRQGWPAHAIEATARMYSGRGSKKIKLRHAIRDCAARRYYGPEEQVADETWLRKREAANEARAAIKATRATRPKVPPTYKSIRAACRSLLDCDRLTSALEAGWSAEDIRCTARQLSICIIHIPNRETPATLRAALELIEGRPAGHFLPRLQNKDVEGASLSDRLIHAI